MPSKATGEARQAHALSDRSHALFDRTHVSYGRAYVLSGWACTVKAGWAHASFVAWQPYLQSCISNTTVEHLQSTGAWSSLEFRQPNVTGSKCAANVTSPESLIAQNNFKANVYKCPGARFFFHENTILSDFLDFPLESFNWTELQVRRRRLSKQAQS